MCHSVINDFAHTVEIHDMEIGQTYFTNLQRNVSAFDLLVRHLVQLPIVHKFSNSVGVNLRPKALRQ